MSAFERNTVSALKNDIFATDRAAEFGRPSGDCRTWPVLVLPVFTVPLFTRQTPPKAETIQAKNPS